MKYYYLAFFIWVLEIILFISIIFMPILFYLRDEHNFFEKPFYWAYINNLKGHNIPDYIIEKAISTEED